MQFGVKLQGLGKVIDTLATLSGPQARAAYAAALNDVGFRVQSAMRQRMAAAFDRPTTYILNSVFVKKATADNLTVVIEPTYYGGKGIDPQQVLQAESFGGARRDKRSEVALRRIGVLPAGYQTAIPVQPYPGSDDGNGNLRGAFLVQLLSYFQAMGEQGYRANMTAKRKAAIHKGKQLAGPLQPGRKRMTDGRRYFVAYGKLRGGKTSHLASGIWAASGLHGVDLKPVLLFVKRGSYSVRLDMQSIALQVDTDAYLAQRMRFRIRQAAGI